MEVGHTNRGFALSKFIDYYGSECVLQDSSIMSPECIWFGTNVSAMQVMASELAPVLEEYIQGLKKIIEESKGQTTGWVNVALPKKCVVNDRMHLTRDHVADILPHLAAFVETASIEGKTSHELAYKCAKCGHIYQAKVDRCDCLDDGEDQAWLIGTAYFSGEE